MTYCCCQSYTPICGKRRLSGMKGAMTTQRICLHAAFNMIESGKLCGGVLMNSTKPLALARNACDTMMRKYDARDLPPKGHFHYHQGVFLSGMHQTFLLDGDERYFSYIKHRFSCSQATLMDLIGF